MRKNNVLFFFNTLTSTKYDFINKHNYVFFYRQEFNNEKCLGSTNINWCLDYTTLHVDDMETVLAPAAVSAFKQFFKDVNIARPYAITHTKSLQRIKGLATLRRLNTYLARSGKFYKTSKILLSSFWEVEYFIKNQLLAKKSSLAWHTFYSALVYFRGNNILTSFNMPNSFIFKNDLKLKNHELYHLEDYSVNFTLKEMFKKFNFLFSFYIYKVDKQIYKNSRGRSGKYTFVWKYVAPYKRQFLIMHWLMREVRIAPGRTLVDRVKSVIHSFLLNTELTWIWKIKKFSLNYVYFNLRKTLGTTCRTSMR